MTYPAEKEALSLLLRRAARAHLRLNDGDYWPSDVADAQAEALIAAGYVIPPAEVLHDLYDVAAEFGIDLDDDSPIPPDKNDAI